MRYGFKNRVDRLVSRVRDLMLAAQRNHLAGDPVEFETITCIEVIRH
jgi:hypothetical protein